MFLGHLNGDYVHDRQPAKFAAIEARWHDEQPAAEVLLALPDSEAEANRYEVKIPVLGSLIATMTLDSKEVGLTSFPKADRPPVAIPFFAFRTMVGCGLLMLGLAWLGSLYALKHVLPNKRRLLWGIFLGFPLPFIATLTGWFTAEVGRQPWVVYGLLRTADATTPGLTAGTAFSSLVLFGCIYTVVFSFGTLFIFRLLRSGPSVYPSPEPPNAKRPLAFQESQRVGGMPPEVSRPL
jgi:cytochrome d ubiquinol oxidase subunit I